MMQTKAKLPIQQLTHEKVVDDSTNRLCFGYCRVSGDSQIDGDGPLRQEAAICEYCLLHKLEVVKVFNEDGVSGRMETVDRPAFKEMMDEIASTGVVTVVIEKLDRLSRDVLIQETAIRRVFQRYGVTLLSTMEPDLMSSDPSRVFIRVVLGAVAEMDRANITHRLSAAKARIRASGRRCEGQKPHAFTDAGKAAIDRIRELRAEGLGFDKIALRLNSEGIPTKRQGTRWHGWSVNVALRSAP